MNRRLFGAIVLILVVVLLWVIFFFNPGVEQKPLAAKPTGGDFTLQSESGPVSLHDFRGRVVVLYFGYTWCPDICPTSLSVLSMALNGLDADELARVQAIFVSVDPERDSVQRLQTYSAYFHEKILGVTDSKSVIDRVVRQYGAAYRKVEAEGSAMGYLVDHSASLYLIDENGRLAETLPHGTSAEVLLEHLRGLLKQK